MPMTPQHGQNVGTGLHLFIDVYTKTSCCTSIDINMYLTVTLLSCLAISTKSTKALGGKLQESLCTIMICYLVHASVKFIVNNHMHASNTYCHVDKFQCEHLYHLSLSTVKFTKLPHLSI